MAPVLCLSDHFLWSSVIEPTVVYRKVQIIVVHYGSNLKVQISIKLSDKVENVSLWIALIVTDVTQNLKLLFKVCILQHGPIELDLPSQSDHLPASALVRQNTLHSAHSKVYNGRVEAWSTSCLLGTRSSSSHLTRPVITILRSFTIVYARCKSIMCNNGAYVARE